MKHHIDFDAAKAYIFTQGRKLEQKRYIFHFENGSKDGVIEELQSISRDTEKSKAGSALRRSTGNCQRRTAINVNQLTLAVALRSCTFCGTCPRPLLRALKNTMPCTSPVTFIIVNAKANTEQSEIRYLLCPQQSRSHPNQRPSS